MKREIISTLSKLLRGHHISGFPLWSTERRGSFRSSALIARSRKVEGATIGGFMKKIFKISFLIMGVSFFLGCGADKPEEEVMDLNAKPASSSAEAIPEKPKTGVLHAPGNYIRNTVGQIDKAKKAAAVYEKSASEHIDMPAEDGE